MLSMLTPEGRLSFTFIALTGLLFGWRIFCLSRGFVISNEARKRIQTSSEVTHNVDSHVAHTRSTRLLTLDFKQRFSLPIPALKGEVLLRREDDSAPRVSSDVRCIGDLNHIIEGSQRNCRFENVCYNLTEDTWLYYESIPTPKIFEQSLGILYTFDGVDGQNGSWPFINLNPFDSDFHLTPKVVHGQLPQNALLLNGSFVLHVPRFPKRNVPFNLGHHLWQDLFSIFSVLERLGKPLASSEDVIVLVPRGAHIFDHRIWNWIGHSITDFHPISTAALAPPSDVSIVCVEELIASQIQPLFLPNFRTQLWGMDQLFAGFRRKVLLSQGVSPKLPRTSLLLLTDKFQSDFGAAGGAHRAIYNLDEVHKYLTTRWETDHREVEVVVVRWSTLSFSEQLNLIGKASVLVTPCGGVSFIGSFLPVGGGLIVMDYLSSMHDHEVFGCSGKNQSCSMDALFWGMFAHLRTMYYQIRSPSEHITDNSGPKTYRDGYHVIVDPSRLADLVEAIFYRQGYKLKP